MKKQRIFENNKLIFKINNINDIYENLNENLSFYHKAEILKLIKDYAFDINKRNYLLNTTDPDMVDFLIKKGADLNTSPENLVRKASLEKTKVLLDNGIDMNKINKYKIQYPHFISINRKKSGSSRIEDEDPLYSSKYTSPEKLKILIKNGLNINHLDSKREHALFKTKNCELLEILIKNGINIKQINKDEENILFSFSLHERFSNMENKNKIIEILINNGAEINQINKSGNNVLFSMMTSRTNFSLLDFDFLDDDYETEGFLKIINYGADIHYINKAQNQNSLFLAHYKETEILLDYCVDFYQEDSEGRFPVFYQCEKYLNSILMYDDQYNVMYEKNMLSLLSLYENKGFDFTLKNKNDMNLIEFMCEVLKKIEIREREPIEIHKKVFDFLIKLELPVKEIFMKDDYKDILFVKQLLIQKEKEILKNTLKENICLVDSKKKRI